MPRPDKISPDIIGDKVDLGIYTLDHKGFILYALGIGFSTDPLKTDDFKYTYELDKRFTTFPTVASCFGQELQLQTFAKNNHLPEFPFHTVLHGEERLHMVHSKLIVGGKYHVESEFIDIIDRGEGKGVFLVNRLYGYLLDGKGGRSLAYYVDRNTFARSLGGSGIKSTGKLKPIPNTPKRECDQEWVDTTFPNQALLYRLNSDPNPLHVDPENAKKAGFPRPIIHGLASYGTVVRSVVQKVLQNDAERVQSVDIRFTGHVFPGESLKIKIWKDGQRIFFEAATVERNKKSVTGIIGLRQEAKL